MANIPSCLILGDSMLDLRLGRSTSYRSRENLGIYTSPDSNSTVFIVGRNGYEQNVFLKTKQQRISMFKGYYTYARWLSNSKYVLLSGLTYNGENPEKSFIISTADGSNKHIIQLIGNWAGSENILPSPDNSYIAIFDQNRIIIVRLKDFTEYELWQDDPSFSFPGSWSPLGGQFAYRGGKSGEKLYVFDLQTQIKHSFRFPQRPGYMLS